MTVYNKEQKWKKWLLLFAILIAAFSIIFTSNLVKEPEKEEKEDRVMGSDNQKFS